MWFCKALVSGLGMVVCCSFGFEEWVITVKVKSSLDKAVGDVLLYIFLSERNVNDFSCFLVIAIPAVSVKHAVFVEC